MRIVSPFKVYPLAACSLDGERIVSEQTRVTATAVGIGNDVGDCIGVCAGASFGRSVGDDVGAAVGFGASVGFCDGVCGGRTVGGGIGLDAGFEPCDGKSLRISCVEIAATPLR